MAEGNADQFRNLTTLQNKDKEINWKRCRGNTLPEE
jgi:hypothetical protein